MRFDVDGWYGIFAPKGTAATAVTTVNREIARLLTEPALREPLAKLNIADEPLKSPAEFAKTVADDYAVWRAIVRTINVR